MDLVVYPVVVSSDSVFVASHCFAVGWFSAAADFVAVKNCVAGVEFVAADYVALAADSVAESSDSAVAACVVEEADYVAVAADFVVCSVLVVYFALLVGCLLD